jgi:lipopolysaccharide biosynthesis regulator YciM
MEEKTLQLRRIFVQAIFNNLRNTPPKDFPTIAEVKTTIKDILPALKEHVEAYITIFEEARDANNDAVEKKITEEDLKVKIEEFNKRIVEYTKTEGQEIVTVVLSVDGMKTLTEQFNREDWGKRWLQNIEEFAEVLAAFEEAGK